MRIVVSYVSKASQVSTLYTPRSPWIHFLLSLYWLSLCPHCFSYFTSTSRSAFHILAHPVTVAITYVEDLFLAVYVSPFPGSQFYLIVYAKLSQQHVKIPLAIELCPKGVLQELKKRGDVANKDQPCVFTSTPDSLCTSPKCMCMQRRLWLCRID